MHVSLDALLPRFDAFFLDAYGVLVDAAGALPGAAELLRVLSHHNKSVFVVTNDASRLPTTAAQRFARLGLPLEPEQIVSSGSLLSSYFENNTLKGDGCWALGPPDALRFVELAGGRILPWTAEPEEVSVIVMGDEATSDPLLSVLDAVLSLALARLDRGLPLHLVVPNPDLLYPKSAGRFGLAAGSFAAMLEGAIRVRSRAEPAPTFVRLGKPYAPIFEAAIARAGVPRERAVMFGDQVDTDILGANRVGLSSVLVLGGVARGLDPNLEPAKRPTHTIELRELLG